MGIYTVQVTEEGTLNPGKTSHYAIQVNGGMQVDSVQADPVRFDAVFDHGDGDYDIDVTIPSPIPVGSQLYISVTSGAETSTGALTITH
jgi:hypothetical protein